MKYEYTSELAPEYIYITDAATNGILIQIEDPDYMTQISIPFAEIGKLRMALLEMERNNLGGLDA